MKFRKIFVFTVFFAGCLMLTGIQNTLGASSGIVIENPEQIVQLQVGTMRTEVRQQEFDKVLKGLQEVTLVDSQKQPERGDDFLSILLIYEDGHKDKFFFFEQDENWYMETGEGEVYGNAGFITDIIHVEEAGTDGGPVAYIGPEAVHSLISKDQSQMLHEYAKKEGFYPTEEEVEKETEKYLSDFMESPDYEEYAKICEDSGYEFEELVRAQNDWILNSMVTFRYDNLRRREYMEGQDTIDGIVYENFADYRKAFQNKYVYGKAYLNEMYKEKPEKTSD